MAWKDPTKKKAYYKAYYSRYPEKQKEYSRRYRISHREQRNARSAAYNPAYQASHREESKISCAAYYASHRAEKKIRDAINRAVHPETRQAANARRRALKAGLPATLTRAEWEAIKMAYKHRCAYCGTKGTQKSPLTQDHVIPIKKGGGTTSNNIVPACQSCNSRKHTGPPPKPVKLVLL